MRLKRQGLDLENPIISLMGNRESGTPASSGGVDRKFMASVDIVCVSCAGPNFANLKRSLFGEDRERGGGAQAARN